MGLLVNSGYLTALERIDANTVVVKVPNDEVMTEFQMLIAGISGIDGLKGEVICVGLAHDKRRCEMVYKEIVL